MAAPCVRMASRPLSLFVSCFSRTAVRSTGIRPLCTSGVCRATLQSKTVTERAGSPWNLVAAVCLQRLPVISAELSPIEQQFRHMMQQVGLFVGDDGDDSHHSDVAPGHALQLWVTAHLGVTESGWQVNFLLTCAHCCRNDRLPFTVVFRSAQNTFYMFIVFWNLPRHRKLISCFLYFLSIDRSKNLCLTSLNIACLEIVELLCRVELFSFSQLFVIEI